MANHSIRSSGGRAVWGLLTTYTRDGLVSGHYNLAVISGCWIADRGCGRGVYSAVAEAIATTSRWRRRCHYSAVAEAMPLSTEFALHDPFDLLDTAVVLQNIVATPAATVLVVCVSFIVFVGFVVAFVVIVGLFVFGSFVVRHFN